MKTRIQFYKIRIEENSICACTHVESGSLSLLPRPGILKAFARLFFPPSGAKAVMYSSKPTRAADSRRFDNNETHSENIQTPIYAHWHTSTRCCIVSLWIILPPQYCIVFSYFCCYASCLRCVFMLLFHSKHSSWWATCTWPLFACALLLCKLLN